jgi:hypothetical protein
MTPRLGLRFWAACGLAVSCTALTVLTVMWPTWIEGLFGFDPDEGSGALEWAFATLPFLAIVGVLLARVKWRRIQVLATTTQPDRAD